MRKPTSKAAKMRKRREERAELRALQIYKGSTLQGGTQIDRIAFNDLSSRAFNVATNLDHTLVLRRDDYNTWRVIAVKR